MKSIKEKVSDAYGTLKDTFGYTSIMQSPRLVKVVVSSGTGSLKDKNKVDIIIDRLTQITGQKPKANVAKKSIATFKLREGMIIGYSVTMRGERAHQFLDKLIHVALPRTRDFRGLEPKAIDEMGNLTIGIKENSIFPECANEDLKDVFGVGITIVTTAKNKTEAEAFFRHLGLPLKKSE